MESVQTSIEHYNDNKQWFSNSAMIAKEKKKNPYEVQTLK